MRRRRKKSVSASSGHERWLITYSDLITLLMIFFVVLYAMSKVDVAKFMTLSESLNQALFQNHQIPMQNLGTTALLSSLSADNQNQTLKPNTKANGQKEMQLQNLYEQLKQYIAANGLDQQVSIEDQKRGVEVTLKDVVLFDTGQAVLKPVALKVLGGMVPFVKEVNNQVLVEGHTDDRSIHTRQFPSNWELSTDRAVNVVHFLSSSGVDPHRLGAVGYGQWRPIVPNNSSENRQQNRRVNIVILRNGTDSTAQALTS